MSQLDQTIQVNISRETSAVTQAAFNVPCFISAHTAFAARTKEYTSLEAVAADFATTSNSYIAASRYFGQERRPPKIVIGRRQVDSVNCTINSVVVGATYTIIANGVTFSYVAQTGATQQVIIDGLYAAWGGGSHSGLTMTDNTGSFTVAVDTNGTGWSFKASSNITVTQASPTESWATTGSEVKKSSTAFYGLNIEDHTDAAILAMSAWANSNNVLFVAATASPAVLTAVTDDIASQLNDLAYSRVALLFSKNCDTQFPECAWVGDRLPPVAGSAQWIYAQLQGVTPDGLTDDEIANLNSKKCNYYIKLQDSPMTKKGWTVDGHFIEETMIVDWTRSRMQERLLFRMINSLKLPSSDQGLTVIQNDIYSVLYEGVRNGAFSPSPYPVVTVPAIADIDPNLRAQGIVTGIKFKATMIISITEIIIDGTVLI